LKKVKQTPTLQVHQVCLPLEEGKADAESLTLQVHQVCLPLEEGKADANPSGSSSLLARP
jgi:hypothetical protein